MHSESPIELNMIRASSSIHVMGCMLYHMYLLILLGLSECIKDQLLHWNDPNIPLDSS